MIGLSRGQPFHRPSLGVIGGCTAAVVLVAGLDRARPQDAPQSWGPAVIVSPGDAAQARDVITRQLDAIQHGDGDAAIAASAPAAQRRFPSPAAFMAMVRADYGALIRSNRIRFGAIRGAAATPTQAGTWNQTVTLATRDGETWTAVYGLEREADGTLKITSCVLIRNVSGET